MMTSTLEQLRDRARANPKRIILPESSDPRVLAAADQLAQAGLAHPVLVIDGDRPADLSTKIDSVTPNDGKLRNACAERLYQNRAHKGMTLESAAAQVSNPLYFGALLVGIGWADGAVAGSIASTADVVRSVLHGLGTAPGTKTVSSFFLMQFETRAVTYADCGLIPDPTVEQLADITISAAANHQRLTGETPKVAMLSFSTHGSANHPNVDKVIAATKLVRHRDPHLLIDGELQFDAAWVPAVASRKCPDSTVAGHANVFIFPNLDSGNIAYKITERIGGAQALGPLIQGSAKPMMDLSRGCSVEDIVNVAVIASVLANDAS